MCLAGCLSVCHSRYCIKTTKPILKLFRPSGSPIVEAFGIGTPCADTKFQGEPLHQGHLIHGGGKNWRFSMDIAIYLGNGARWVDSYYGTLIGSHGWWINWYNFRWPWVTPNPGFKLTGYLKVEYLAIAARVFSCTKHSCRSLRALLKTCKKIGSRLWNFFC